jgi:triacylglycerol lipase
MRNPILLVHGIWDTGAVFGTMRSFLSGMGWTVHDLDMNPNNGDSQLEYLADQVADYIDRNFAADQPIDLVGFSMGGIVSRYYIQRLQGIRRVDRFVTLPTMAPGSPIVPSALVVCRCAPTTPFSTT